MNSQITTKSFQLQDGRTIEIETGKLAKQADGSVVVKMGATMLLATVVSKRDVAERIDFFPLSVDYQERFASSGKIPGGFFKREGKLSDYEIMVSRLVDRAIRPMFPDDYRSDTQVNINLISVDSDQLPDSLAALAASAALTISDIPFNGPISEVRVARVAGEHVVNPGIELLKKADIDIIVAASEHNITMVEGEMKEVSETDMMAAIKFAHDAIRDQIKCQNELAKELSVTKREYSHEINDTDLRKNLYEQYYKQFYETYKSSITSKKQRKDKLQAIRKSYEESLPEDHDVNMSLVSKYFHAIEKDAARNLVLETRIRIDGRQLDEVRLITSEIDYLPSTHGSALFTRGETQSLTTVTLGTKLDEQTINGAVHTGSSKFMLHYNFPGFSTGEVKPNRGPGRREVGHGNLAMRALKAVIPEDADNPYTIRIVSDVLESNGSSSMATVCAGSLALMDSGIQIKEGVSGIAMGLISDSQTDKYAILSDILGDEDHLGDMDFKVAGTSKGITACQMDIKVAGLSYKVLDHALEQAKAGRNYILSKMNETIQKPSSDMKPNAPRNKIIKIARDMIGAVIGPGGKIVQEIQKVTDSTVIIEERDGHGLVSIFALNEESMNQAYNWIKGITAVPEVGEVYEGKVKTIVPFGAFVEFMPGKDGLLHISEIKWERLEKIEGILEIGEEIQVKLTEIDPKTGKFRLSRKVLLPKPGK